MHVTERLRLLAVAAAMVTALGGCTGGETVADADADADGRPSGNATEAASRSAASPEEVGSAEGAASADPAPGAVSELPSDDVAMTQPSLPPDGEPGSLATMATQPAATAAQGNPNLTTLVQAVQAAGLVDTLNGPGPFTVFAPVNEAFAAIPPADLEALLADQERLAAVLTYHVVQGQALPAADLSLRQEVTTTAPVAVTPEGETVSLNDGQATVVYPDIQVANGVVHLIDGVLMPPLAG